MVVSYYSPKTFKEAFRLAEVVIEERTNEIYLLEANLHECRNPKHRVTMVPPYWCINCKWESTIRPNFNFEIAE